MKYDKVDRKIFYEDTLGIKYGDEFSFESLSSVSKTAELVDKKIDSDKNRYFIMD